MPSYSYCARVWYTNASLVKSRSEIEILLFVLRVERVLIFVRIVRKKNFNFFSRDEEEAKKKKGREF